MGSIVVGGRALPLYEENHTIPVELFRTRMVPLVQLFYDMGGNADVLNLDFDFDGPLNLQRLPAEAYSGYGDIDAVHHGRHTGMTTIVKERLGVIFDDLSETYRAQINIAMDTTQSPIVRAAAQANVRAAIVFEMSAEVEMLQFKATNFMDTVGSTGNRMIFNSRDWQYFTQTETFRQLPPAEQQRILTHPKHKISSALIAEHNRLVMEADLTVDRRIEMKVMRELGEGTLGFTDGSAAARDGIRGWIAQAQGRGINLLDPNVNAMNVISGFVDELNAPVQSLTTQIDSLAEQIASSSGAARQALVSQQTALVAQRTAILEAQTIGNATFRISANQGRTALFDTLLNSRTARAITSVGGRLARALAPVVVSIAEGPVGWAIDAGSLLLDAHELGLRYSDTYRDKVNAIHKWATGKDLDRAVYVRGNNGFEAFVEGHDENGIPVYEITVVGKRAGTFWLGQVYTISSTQAGTPPVTAGGNWRVAMDSWAEFAVGIAWEKILEFIHSSGLAEQTQPKVDSAVIWARQPDGDPFAGVLTWWDRLLQPAPLGPLVLDVPHIDLDAPNLHIEVVDDQTAVQHQASQLDAQGNPTSDTSTTVGISGRDKVLRFLDTPQGQTAQGIGGAFGSLFVSQLDIDEPLLAIGVSSILSAFTADLAIALVSPDISITEAFENLPTDIRQAAVGAVSSYLWGELVADMGIDGVWGAALTTVGGAAIGTIANNIISGGFSAWSNGLGGSIANAAASFLGAYLGSRVVHVYSELGQMFASFGSSIGGIIGQAYGGVVGAFVGSFLGYIAGGLIGSLLNGPLNSGAQLVFNQDGQGFRSTGVYAKNGATPHAVNSVVGAVSYVLQTVLYRTGSYLVDSESVRFGEYRTHNARFRYVTTDASGKNYTALDVRDPDKIVRLGALVALADMLPRLVGGNVYLKRAIAATFVRAGLDPTAIPLNRFRLGYRGTVTGGPSARDSALAFDPSVLLGNLTIAEEYTILLQNAQAIGSLMSLEPDSPLAAIWAATIASAIELGLNRRAATDWTGGWTIFLDEAVDRRINGISFTPANMEVGISGANERVFQFFDGAGNLIGALGDTIDTKAKNSVVGSLGNDTIVINGSTLSNTTGLTIDNEPGSGPLQIDVAATIFADEGDDVVVAGDRGNDVFGGLGNDTLVGGKLDDWIYGEEGNDRLFAAQPANYQFSDTDAAAVALAIGTVSNGDMLDGGDGDDILYGSKGSDWLRGGEGVDTLRGGDGADIIEGGGGDDRGSAGEARLLGGSGNDQYVFGYGDGVDVLFDESSPGAAPGFTTDSIYTRIQALTSGAISRNWGGGGDYESVDGNFKGGEDAIAFGIGIGLQDLRIRRSGTAAAPGNDLIIQLTWLDPTSGIRYDSGDFIQIKDWFETSRRVEWLRFANGEEIRIADISSYIVGTASADVIIGTDQADFMYGGTGNDTMYGLAGDDFGFGGEGNDLVAGDEDNDMVSGGSGDDIVIGGLGNDTVFGDAGNDTLNGGDGADLLVGGRGDDSVVGGAGDDIFKFARGDGRDSIMDAYVDNWEIVYQNGNYVNGYVRDLATGVISKNGVVVFDGAKWIGVYDYTDSTITLRRHLGAVGGAIAGNSGATDTVEFGAGINIQDLMLRRQGNDLQVAVTANDGDPSFDSVADRLTIRDWYLTGAAIEQFSFVATGRHSLAGISMPGNATDGADVLVGTAGTDWITGNGGDDTISGSTGEDILSGNGGNDILRGEAGYDVLYGGAGDDTLEGGADGDYLIGGTGTDIASYANSASPNNSVRAFLNAPGTNTGFAAMDQYNSIEGLEGTSGADRLGGDDGDNVLRSLAGNDALFGGAGDDVYEIESGNGQDTILDTPFTTEEIISAAGVFNSAQYQATWTHLGTQTVNGVNRRGFRLVVTRRNSGEEVYRSRDWVDYLYNTTASPAMAIPAATAWVSANSQWSAALGVTRPSTSGTPAFYTVRELFTSSAGGFDTLDFGAGIGISDLTFARLNGGADLRITYASGNYVTITGQNDLNRAVDVLQLRDGLTADLTRLVLVGETASAEGDFVVGDATANTLDGLAGDDVISGGAGNDTLRGGDGDDILEGGAGSDTLNGGNDAITAGEQIDSSDVGAYGDTIRYVRSTAAVNINLNLATPTASGGHAAGDVIVAVNGVSTIENVVGSDGFGDTLRGDGRANRLAGLGGDDTLEGNGGNDVLGGGLGNDILRGGDGNDDIAGDAGNDTLEGGTGSDLLAGGDGVDTISGDAGDDVLTGGAGNDTLRGGADADSVSGEAGDDQLWGDAGEDEITGGEGDDIIQGGTDDDSLAGEAGNDQLYGDQGNDRLTGGDGNDTVQGGDGDDILWGNGGDDQLRGDTGADQYVFSPNSGVDTIVDATGDNSIIFEDVETSQLWLTRLGNDLRIGVVGGTSVVTVQGYYASTSPTLVSQVNVGEQTLYLAAAGNLIQAMTAVSAAATPASVPQTILDMLDAYWFAGGAATPIVGPQSLSTNEDTPLTGSVQATDPDNNITGYAVATGPAVGSLSLNTTTGTWTYMPNSNVYGNDGFDIRVTDADGNTASQHVSVAINAVNDAPTAINASGVVTSIDERDRPIAGTPSPAPAIVLATLTVSDPDAGGSGDFASHAFSVNNSNFEAIFDGVNWLLRLKSGAALDYESATSASVTVTATDRNGAGLSVQRTFTFNVNNRDDYFYGTAGADNITGTAGQNLIYGQGGNDILTGANANDLLDGGDGGDQLYGLGGIDTLYGQFGDDTLDGGAGDDTLRGGDGNDTLLGSDGTDQLFGDAGLDNLQGGLGNDQLDGGGDNDQLDGGAGDDRLVGGSGSDTMIGGAGADRFNGGSGTGEVDVVSYASASAGVTLSLAAGTGTGGDAAGDIFEDTPERVIGSAYADNLTGSAGNDILEGGAGNDVLNGGAGADQLFGGDGNDTLDAQAGDDTLDGGAGSDILIGGADHDLYLLDVNSGADEIRNFDATGLDVDLVGYDGISYTNLWFERSGDDLIVSAVGTNTRTTIKNWYATTQGSDRANYKIDFFIAGGWTTKTLNAESLAQFMTGYTRPTTIAQYDALHATPGFEAGWTLGWNPNAAPTIGVIGTQTINERGRLDLGLAIADDRTPLSLLSVTATSSNPALVNAPTVDLVNGVPTLHVTTVPYASGQTTITVAVSDGTLSTQQVFQLNVTAVADRPTVTQASVSSSPTAPAVKNTFDGGAMIRLNLQAALADQDGSESIYDVQVSNVPNGITFRTSSGASVGTVVTAGALQTWSFTAGQLGDLWLQGPANWNTDLTLSVTARSRESSTGEISTYATAVNLPIEINARPNDITPNNFVVAENTAPNSLITTFTRSDGDSGDSAAWSLADSLGGRFTLNSSNGELRTGNTNINFETDGPYTLTVRVTDSGGLTYSEPIQVLIANVNEAPTIVAPGSLQVSENAAAGTGVGQYSRTDPDVGDIATYSLIDNGLGHFAINSSTGQVTMSSVPIDFEAPNSQAFNITVRVTDAGGLWSQHTGTVTVLPVNEAPTINSSSFSILEGRYGGPGGALPIVLSGSDPEGSALNWTLDPATAGPFSITSTGTLLLAAPPLDYENGPRNYSVTVRASDGVNVISKPISIAITDDNEAPTFTWAADSGFDTYIGRITGTDPEGGAVTVTLLSAQLYYHYVTWDNGILAEDDYYWAPANYYPGWGSAVTVDAIGRLYSYFPGGIDGDQNGDPPYWHERTCEAGEAIIQLRDPTNRTTQVTVHYTYSTSYIAPVVLDLDGDGVELVSMQDSQTSFAMSADNPTARTGWVGADDAFLALDRNGDGLITSGSEISFVQDLPDALTDLEGLTAFDTNGNGLLDAGDERFSDFRVWNDANQDGISQASELRSLTDAGLSALSLMRTLTDPSPDQEQTVPARRTNSRHSNPGPGRYLDAEPPSDDRDLIRQEDGNVVSATTEFIRLDGSRGVAADAVLAFQEVQSQVVDSYEVDPETGLRIDPLPVSVDSDSTPADVDRTSHGQEQAGERTTASRAPREDSADADTPSIATGGRFDWRRGLELGQPADFASSLGNRLSRLAPKRDNFVEGEWQPDARAPAAGALHAPLGSVARRRLQMIDAMASFAPEGAAELELRPHRHVDSRTLLLMTQLAAPGTWNR